MRRTAHFNQERLKELGKEDQQFTCTICFDQIDLSKQTSLDCCTHKYCYNCINKWVNQVENTCPQCKRSIKKLSYQDPEGETKEEVIIQRRQDDILDDCYACEEPVNRADVFFHHNAD